MSGLQDRRASRDGAISVSIFNRRQRYWSDAEIDFVVDQYQRGYTCAQIAEGLVDRTRSSVSSILKRVRDRLDERMAAPVRTQNLTRMDRVAELLSEGMELAEVAKALKLPPRTVRATFQRIKAGLGPQAR